MNKNMKKIALFTMAAALISACGSASSDAKKVEKKVPAPVEKLAKVDPAMETTSPAKKAVPEGVESGKFIEGKHYAVISPEMQTDAAPGKVEVVEMMWLGCPHCYTLEPRMLKYKKNHPDFVEFKQVPAMLNPSWAADANTYYIADILDPSGEKELITQVFQAIHEQKRRLRSADAAKRFFVQLGYTEDQVDNAKNSMVFKAKIKRAQEVSEGSKASAVPTIIINGKYRTSPYMAGSEESLMEIIDMLTQREKN